MNDPANSDLAEVLLGQEEGREPCVYPDSSPLHLLTIAIGCVVDPRVPGAGLCNAAIDVQFQHDKLSAIAIAMQFPGFNELNDVQRTVLISMAFQMGSKPLRWPNFMGALQARDFAAAGAAGLDSDWARDETPARAKREMAMLASGNWVGPTTPLQEDV